MKIGQLSIQSIIENTPELPSMPTAVLSVIRESGSASSSAKSVAEHIAQDQALTARILRLANSAYYGLERKVTDIEDAVIVLGMRAVRSLAMVASTYTWMSKPLKAYGLGPKELWAHSFGVGVCSEMLAKKTSKTEPETAFTAGLLHNMGKTVLNVWLHDRTAALAKAAQRAEMPFDEIERRMLGFDHAQVGAALAEKWNLPESITSAIRYHHLPDAAEEHRGVVDCVHLADCLTTGLGIGLGIDGKCYRVSEHSFERLSLQPATCDDVLAECAKRNREYEVLMTDFDGPSRKAA